MVKVLRFAGAAGVAALVILLACSSENGGGSSSASLTITSTTSTIDSQGGTTQLTVQATDASGRAGQGQVDFTAGAGFFSATSLTLAADGSGTTTYRCDQSADARCATIGSVHITATWTPAVGTPVTATKTIAVTLSPKAV